MFRELAETTGILAWMTEPDGFCFYLSHGWYRFTGAPTSTGGGYEWLDAIHPADRVRTRQAYFRANDAQIPYATDYRLQRASGGYALVWATGLPELSKDGKFHGYRGISTSIDQYRERADLSLDPRRGPVAYVLSPREREVVRLIADGNTSDKIAAVLGISYRTVEAHVTNAATKLGATNRVHTVAKALKLNEI